MVLIVLVSVAAAQQNPQSLFQAASQGDKAALAELTALADKGNAKAQWFLGCVYEFGKAAPKDMRRALALYGRAAANGDATAARYLGSLYGAGDVVPKDDSLSWKWWERSAELGDETAQLWVGKLYALRGLRERGQELVGNPPDGASAKDLIAAYMWFNLAAAKGKKEASNQRDSLVTVMTSAQIAEAQRLSTEWKAKK